MFKKKRTIAYSWYVSHVVGERALTERSQLSSLRHILLRPMHGLRYASFPSKMFELFSSLQAHLPRTLFEMYKKALPLSNCLCPLRKYVFFKRKQKNEQIFSPSISFFLAFALLSSFQNFKTGHSANLRIKKWRWTGNKSHKKVAKLQLNQQHHFPELINSSRTINREREIRFR